MKLNALELREGDADNGAVESGGMFTNKGLGGLLLILKLHKSLLLAIDFVQLGVDHTTMLLDVGHNLILSNLLGEGGEVDHPCRCTAVPVVLYGIVVEPVQGRVCILVCVKCRSYVRVLGEVHLHFLPKEHRALIQKRHDGMCTSMRS
jgi:hypothetical protein